MPKSFVLALVSMWAAGLLSQAQADPGYVDSRGVERRLAPAADRIAVFPAEGDQVEGDLAARPELQWNGRSRHADGLLEIPLAASWRNEGRAVTDALAAQGLIKRRAAVFAVPGTSHRFWLDTGVIVELRSAGAGEIAELLAGTGLAPELALGHAGTTFLCRAPDADAALAGARSASALPQVAYAVPDFRVPIQLHHQPTDPLYGLQWHHAQASGAHIYSEEAWDVTLGDSQVIVAVIDTGVDEAHPDFDPALQVTGFDVVGNDNDPTPLSGAIDAHGTCCAGEIVAVADNAEGLVGVCPGCSLMGIRMMNGAATQTEISNGYLAIQYATDNGAWVLSNSWGIDQSVIGQVDIQPFYQAVQDAVTNGRGGAGAVVLFASGNGDWWTGQGVPIGSSELANRPEVMAVGGTGYNDLVVSYSDYGPNLSVTAPTGVSDTNQPQIVTTDTIASRGFSRNGTHWAPGFFGTDENTGMPEPDSSGNYTQYFNGTSASCPIAAGVVALVFSANPALTGVQARFVVEQTADKVGGVTYDANGHHIRYGYGRVNAGRAARAAQVGFDNAGGSTCAEDFNCLSGVCLKGSPTDSYGTCEGLDCSALPDGTACSDGDVCTGPDTCTGGVCFGEVLTCGDGNPCTDDSCDPASGCAYTPNTAPCDDLDVCTESDVCAAGACGGTPITCADADPCTDDGCDPVSGCTFTPNTAPCDDSDSCTHNDICGAGQCVGTAYSCDDSNVCTDDGCDGLGGCDHPFNTSPCDDGNPCTADDVCAGGACAGAPTDCDDGNPCTDDACDAVGGCQNTPNTAACDDGDACTSDDACAAGSCVGIAVDCDDGNPCTDDSCDAAGACVVTQNTAECDDGDACTIGDVCAEGSCSGQPMDCTSLDGDCGSGVCDPASGECVLDAEEDGTACDDGDACSADDACAGGQCRGDLPDCSHLDAVCLRGACDPASGECSAVPADEGLGCDDGDECTGGSTCQSGECAGGQDICSGGGGGCGCATTGRSGWLGWLSLGLLGALCLLSRRRRQDRP